jgi:hypothetical protein
MTLTVPAEKEIKRMVTIDGYQKILHINIHGRTDFSFGRLPSGNGGRGSIPSV